MSTTNRPDVNLPKDWRILCAKLNKVTQNMLVNLPPVTVDNTRLHEQKKLCYSLLMRTLNHFRGSCIMLEKGLVIDALTLSRSCIESAIYLSALKENEAILDNLRKDDTTSQKGMAQIAFRIATLTSDENLQKLAKEKLKEMEGLQGERLKIEKLAEDINRLDLYALYRNLSSTAAHPSLYAILQGFNSDNGKDIWLGEMPIEEEKKSVQTAYFCNVAGLITACTKVSELVGNYQEKELNELVIEIERVITLTTEKN